MARLEELCKGTVVNALDFVYKAVSGGVDSVLLYRHNEPRFGLLPR